MTWKAKKYNITDCTLNTIILIIIIVKNKTYFGCLLYLYNDSTEIYLFKTKCVAAPMNDILFTMCAVINISCNNARLTDGKSGIYNRWHKMKKIDFSWSFTYTSSYQHFHQCMSILNSVITRKLSNNLLNMRSIILSNC